MADDVKGTETSVDEQESGKKTFTQEELDKIIDKRLERERKKSEQKISELEKKIEELGKQKQGTEEKLTEAEQIKQALDEMKRLKAEADDNLKLERFQKEVIKHANKFEIDAEKALEFFNYTNVRKNEDGDYDFEATFSGFKEAFGSGKKKDDIGKPTPQQPPQTKKRSEMSVTERVEYQTKYGVDAYAKLPY